MVRRLSPQPRRNDRRRPGHDVRRRGVVPGRKTEERARTDPFTERRRHALIEKGGDPNLAFLAAARRGRVDEIEALLPAQPLPDVADESGRTPLMLAADGCHADAVRVILRHGGSVARTDLDGRDPLAHAFATAKGPECDRTIRVLSYAGARPQRNLLCARLVEAAAAGDTARTDVLVNVARKNYMTDLLAVAHESAVRSRQHDTARKIAAYGPLPPAGSCGPMEPATAVAR